MNMIASKTFRGIDARLVSRKWLVAVFCFFAFTGSVFAQSGPSSDRPYYNPKDGQWYALMDSSFHHGRYPFTFVYDLTNCYRPFYELSIDIVGLHNPTYSGKFGSDSDIYLRVDGKNVWQANTTGKHVDGTSAYKDKNKTVPQDGWVILKDDKNFACPILDWSYFKSRTAADGNKYRASDSRYTTTTVNGSDGKPEWGYYCSRYDQISADTTITIVYKSHQEGYGKNKRTVYDLDENGNKIVDHIDTTYRNPVRGTEDTDDVVLDMLHYFKSDYNTLKNTTRSFGTKGRKDATGTNHSFAQEYGDQLYVRYAVDCKKFNLGLNPETVSITKDGKSGVGRIVVDSLRAKLAPHLSLQSDDGKTLVTEKTIHYIADNCTTATAETYLPFRSFLLDGSWKVLITKGTDDNLPGITAGVPHSSQQLYQAFDIEVRSGAASTTFTRIQQNSVSTLINHTADSGQICGYQGSVYDATTNPAYNPAEFIKIKFAPDTTCTRVATLIFFDDNYYNDDLSWKTDVQDDGMPHMVTIHLSGEYKKPAELKWHFNNQTVNNNGSIDVTYGFNPTGTSYWSGDKLTLSAFSFKDSNEDSRLNGKQACPSNGTIKYFLVDDKGNAVASYDGCSIDGESGTITVKDVTDGLTSKEDIEKAKTVLNLKVMAVITATTECQADTSYINVNVNPKHVILTEAELNTAMCGYDLSSNEWAVSNYESELNFGEFSADDTDPEFVYHNVVIANAATLYHTGKVTMNASSANTDINNAHGQALLPKTTYTVVPGTLYFENGDGDWSNTANWYSHECKINGEYPSYNCVPLGKNHNVEINSNCTVSTPNAQKPSNIPSKISVLDFIDTDVEGDYWNANDVTVRNGSLTVAPTGAVSIEGTLKLHPSVQDYYDRIKVEESASSQGSLIFAEGTPHATVEIVAVGTSGDADPVWQYRGIPVGTFNTISFDSNGDVPMIYKWEEMLQSNPLESGIDEHWTKTNNTGLVGWQGYAFGRLNCTSDTYVCTITGDLTAANNTISLAYTNDDAHNANNKGMNLITNSYNAAIDIASLATTDFVNAEATMYIYNKGTFNDYKRYWNDNDYEGDASAQVSVYPLFSGSAVGAPTVIPSGQSFFVRATTTGGKFSFRHGALKQQNNGAALRAPREPEDFNILTIKVEGNNQTDRVVMMENDNCSREFDNGYDGSKFFMDGVPQIYATNDYGKTDINCDAVMAGNYIGFAAAKNGVKYTISFDTDRLEGYNKLFLYDTQNGRYIDILAGETYTFTGKHSGEDRRFILMGEREDGKSFTGSEQRIEVIGDHAVVCGFDGMDETILITDMSGRVWWQGNTEDGALVNIPSDLAKGVYVISVGKCNTKFVK